jgi:hypothetical protein
MALDNNIGGVNIFTSSKSTEVLSYCETAFHRAIKETRFFPLFFIRAPLDTTLSQLTPVGNTLVIWIGAYAKHQRQTIVTFTSEYLNVCRHASRLITSEHLSFHIFYFYKFGIAIPILVKVERNDKQFAGRSKYIYDLSPLLVFITEMGCASGANKVSLEKELSIDHDGL